MRLAREANAAVVDRTAMLTMRARTRMQRYVGNFLGGLSHTFKMRQQGRVAHSQHPHATLTKALGPGQPC
jgi:hypothetical protein